jgi:hypothetical protein
MKATLSDKIHLIDFNQQQFIRITKQLTIDNPKFAEWLPCNYQQWRGFSA